MSPTTHHRRVLWTILALGLALRSHLAPFPVW